jgi:flagellin
MSLSIHRSTDGVLRAMQRLHAQMDRTRRHLAAGKRIESASDDAAGLAIAKRLEASVRGLAQGERNLADGVDLARTAEGALASSHEALGRMRELTVQAQNGTLSAEDRATIQAEYDQLAEQLDQTAGGANFGGQHLLDGSASGSGAPVITDGSGHGTPLDLPDMRSAALGVAGRSVADPATLAALDQASERVTSVRSRLGAIENHLSHQAESLAMARGNYEAARSRIEDADFAFEVAALTRDRILHGMQLSGLRIAGHSNRRVIDLLG